MIALVRAELLKIRRRQATWVLLAVELGLMGLIFLATGSIYDIAGIIEFPQAYSLFRESIFALGGLIAIVFAAAYVGADWNWGVLRNVIARGEGRERYLLAKFLAMGVALAIAMLIVFAFGFIYTYMQGLVYGIPIASPLRGDGLQDLVVWVIVGFPVLVQRAAIGFAVAVLVRSQLAGAVVGIVLFLVEATVTAILTAITFAANLRDSGGLEGLTQVGPEWFQYLPISIGNQVFNGLPGAGGVTSASDVTSILLRPVPFWIAFGGVLAYTVVALGIALVAVRRQQIT